MLNRCQFTPFQPTGSFGPILALTLTDKKEINHG